jgi:hypothetical protein
MKEKLLLISGCSHASGSEIDGTEDSIYNRQHSFGNLLAKKIGRRPVNISSSASNNQCIARSIIEWFDECYESKSMDIFVLACWTESSRIDVPINRTTWYERWNLSSDYISKTARDYIRVNLGYKGSGKEEMDVIAGCHQFIANNPIYIEIISANLILQIQYFLKLKQINFIMCNTMHMFSEARQLNFYMNQIDQSCYLNLTDNNQSFYWKYKNEGYINPKAKYWHHGEEPHRLYSEELYKLYVDKYNTST